VDNSPVTHKKIKNKKDASELRRAVPLELEVTHLTSTWPARSQPVIGPMLASAKGVGGRSNRSGPMGAWWQKT